MAKSTASPSQEAAATAEHLLADRYLLGARIGSGRFGPIYIGDDTSVSERAPNRRVAVQLLWGELGNHDWLAERFQSEFVRLRSWRHDNIVQVLDFGHDGDRFFWITALLDGASLRSIVTQLGSELLDAAEARAVIVAVGEALQYAHARRKVHGAITLENVFLTSDFCVKILDFAPFAIPNSAPLRADDLKSGSIAAKTSDDVFGLACLTYELLSGRHPYGGSLPDEVRACGLEPERIEGLPRRMWTALRRGLAPAPEQRTATIGEFLNELGIRANERLEPPAPQPGATAPRHGPSRVGKILTWTMALVASAGLAYIGYGTFLGEPSVSEAISAAGSRVQEFLEDFPPLAEDITTDLGEAAAPAPAELAAVEERAASDAQLPAVAAGYTTPLIETELGAESTSIQPEARLDDLARDEPLAETTPLEGTASALPPQSVENRELLAGTAAAPEALVPTAFEFDQTRLTVSENSGIAALVIRRTGSLEGESSLSWWTIGDTAIADEDFADFGTLLETFGPGEQSRTVHIPLVVDTIAEPTERFVVRLRYDSMPGPQTGDSAEIVILDDD